MLVYEGIITDERPYDNDIATISDSLKGKLDKPEGGTYVLDTEMPDLIKKKITGDTKLQELLKGRDGKDGAPGRDGRDGTDGAPGAPGKDGENPNPSDVADLIANSKTYRDKITYGLPDEERVKELARTLDEERKIGGRNLFREKYFAGDLASCFRIPFEAVTPRAEYNTYTLSFDYKISADDKASSPRVSITYKTQTFVWDTKVIRDGAWHHKVITFNLEKMDESEYPLTGWLTDYSSSNGRTIDMVAVRNIKLERGNVATDWTPAPDDFQSEINALQQNVPTEDQKKWIEKMGQVLKLDSKESGNTVTINGLNINRSIFLRFSDGKPAAMIGGNDAVLTAGVSGYGTTNQSVRTAIYQNGAAKFGPVEMGDNGISVKGNNAPIVISGEMVEFIDDVNPSNIDKDIVSGSSITLNSSQREVTYTIPQMNFAWGSTVTISVDKITCNVYQYMAQLELLVDNKVVNSWRGDMEYTSEGNRLIAIATPLVVGGYKHECNARSGQTIKFRITSDNTTDTAQLDGIKIHIYNNTADTQTSVSYEGFRAYFDRSHYFDVYANKTKYYRYGANAFRYGTNEYVARVKGGMRVDSLTLEQPLDAPGCVLAGGRVENGYVRASFGKYKNQRGDVKPNAVFNNSTKVYTIYHSIGNTNYTPIVTSCAGQWGDVPQVVDVSAYSFGIKYINYNNEPSVGWNFNYVCYKGD